MNSNRLMICFFRVLQTILQAGYLREFFLYLKPQLTMLNFMTFHSNKIGLSVLEQSASSGKSKRLSVSTSMLCKGQISCCFFSFPNSRLVSTFYIQESPKSNCGCSLNVPSSSLPCARTRKSIELSFQGLERQHSFHSNGEIG